MEKNHFFPLPIQSPCPPSPSNTPSFINEPHPNVEDDSHICPVCDGECTCNNPSAPLPLLPSLKIKLTVPQSILGKRRAPLPSFPNNNKFKSLQGTTSVAGKGGDPSSSAPPHPPKRRGRPPKAVVAARKLAAARSLADTHAVSSLRPKSLSVKQKQISKSAIVPASRRKGKGRLINLSSDPSDHDDESDSNDDNDDDDADSQSGRFPTFVSASGLSSRASSSSSSPSSGDDLSDFDDSDLSIEDEEEKFILSQMQDREARHRRELLGDNAPKKRDPNNAWVIRPRKKSVGPSDAEMDLDSDATVDDDEDDEDDEDGDDEDNEDADEKIPRSGYIGMATGWSEEDEESSFDADLFFASLYDSEREGEGDGAQPTCTSGDEGDHSDIESVDVSTPIVPSMPPEFEVTEGWDGQIMFTNGFRDGQGLVDMHFEAHAASLAESSSSPSTDQSDLDMNVDTGEDDEGYEQDVDLGNGDTTDEELVGDDDLPNERAMSLFSLPLCVSAINPMSTMSPTVSPAPLDRKPFGLLRCLDSSPNPADILSGKVFCDSDEDSAISSSRPYSDAPEVRSGGGPRTGHFEISKGSRQAVINDLHKDIPSPHPRFHRRKCSSVLHSHHSIGSLAELSLKSPTSGCDDQVVMTSPDMVSADIVDLNDVLEASFMDPEPSDPQSISTNTESRSKQIKNFSHRWDLMSVGAFRQNRTTDGAAGWGSPSTPPAAKTNYGNMMKSSPLSTMLWQSKAGETRRRSRKKSVVISPVILPVHDRDGDRTPTNMPPYNQLPPLHNRRHHDHYPQRSRKELRRERKLQRKSYGPVHHQHQNHQHHSHHHHPNLKTRSTSSLQRMNFSSSVPPLNL